MAGNSSKRLLQEWTQRLNTDATANALHQQRAQAAKALATNERALRRLVDAYEAGAIELEDLQGRSARLREQIQRMRDDLGTTEHALAEAGRLREVVTRFESFAARVRDGLERLSWNDRQHLIRLLVRRVEITPDGAIIVYRIPGSTPHVASTPPTPSGAGDPSPKDAAPAPPTPQTAALCLLRHTRR